MTIRNDTDHEAGADVRFGLAYERLAKEDEERRQWLNLHAREVEPPPAYKPEPREGQCKREGCTKDVRCKGLCPEHYFEWRWSERTKEPPKHAPWLCRVCRTAWARHKGVCRKCAKALAHTHAESNGSEVEQRSASEAA